MRGLFRFVFGGGWWTLWHLAILLPLLPFAFVLSWFWTSRPGSGPQGGEVICLLLVLAVLMFSGVSAVGTVLWLRSSPPSRRLARGILTAPALWIASLVTTFQLADLASSIYAPHSKRVAAMAALALLGALVTLFNLTAVHRHRR